MDKKIVEAVVWAFVYRDQDKKALSTALKLASQQDRDELLIRLSDYYLRSVIMNGNQDQGTLAEIPKCFRSAINAAKEISIFQQSWPVRKRIIARWLDYLKKSGVAIDEIVDMIYSLLPSSFVIPERKPDDFLRKMINIYLETDLNGEQIFKISELMSTEAAFKEAERLLCIFIKWGDYDAIMAIGKKYGKLEEKISSQQKEIFLNCLKRKGIDEAIKALSIISNPSERMDYAELLDACLK